MTRFHFFGPNGLKKQRFLGGPAAIGESLTGGGQNAVDTRRSDPVIPCSSSGNCRARGMVRWSQSDPIGFVATARVASVFETRREQSKGSIVGREFAGMIDWPSSWVGAAHSQLLAITGSMAGGWCFTIELTTEHRSKLSSLFRCQGTRGRWISPSAFFLGRCGVSWVAWVGCLRVG